jgi:hypothetical protein
MVSVYGRRRVPGQVVDRLLWRDAQLMLSRHSAADDNGNCVWCREPYPCPPRELAERAKAISYQPVA